MKRIKELPDFDRPGENLAKKGPRALSDVELIAIIIGRCVPGRDVLQIATEVAKTLKTDVLPLVSDIINKKQDCFVCISLNGAGEVVGNRIVTVGLVNHSLVHPR